MRAPPRANQMPSPQRLSQRSDRNLQDHLIQYLTDASLRSDSNDIGFLEVDEAERAERFSHFLARRYYRDRLHRGFRHAARLLRSEGAAANLVDTPTFDLILNGCVLGSLATARAVGDLVLSGLGGKRSEDWWTELLQYEFAFFVQLATSEPTPVSNFPLRAISTVICEFEFPIPDIMEKLKNGQDVGALRAPTTLLFSRTHHGRIYVVQLDLTASAVIRAVNGSRDVSEIAEQAAISHEETSRVLDDLIRISAVSSPVSETG